jgi:hypothetical protein
MWMLCAGINEEIAFDSVSETSFWQHAVNRLFNYGGRLLNNQLSRRNETLSTRITGMRYVLTLSPFTACETNLISINDDHMISIVVVMVVVVMGTVMVMVMVMVLP